jgi:hypothetical protein
VLTTLTVGDVGSGGTLTITSDKGETFSAAVPASKIVTLSTGFALAATTITIQYTDSWFLEISSLTYAGPPPPGISVKLTLKYSNGSVFTGSAQILAITTNPDGTTSTTTIASAVFDSTGTVSAFIQIDPTKSYNVQVLNPSGAVLYQAPALVQGFLIASLSKATLTATIDKTTGSLVSENYSIQ